MSITDDSTQPNKQLGRRRMSAPLLAFAAMAGVGMTGMGTYPRRPVEVDGMAKRNHKGYPFTTQDEEALEKARLKRERKRKAQA